MIAIIEYGVGNLYSLTCSFNTIGEEVVVTNDIKMLRKADKLLLPGVGAFGDAAEKLRAAGLAEEIIAQAKAGKPLLGICLGMQLLFDKGYEYGEHEGLGLIPGSVRPISDAIPKGFKVPHMGWNKLDIGKGSRLLKYIKNGDYVYFVHSYYATQCEENTVATAEYGVPLTAVVEKGNIFGCQFHPEKSGSVGLEILRAFSEMKV